MIMATLDALFDALGRFAAWAFIGIASGLLQLGRMTLRNKRDIDELKDETRIAEDPTRLEAHERRMEKQRSDIADLKTYFIGDENDPARPGLLSEIHEIKQSLQSESEGSDNE